MSSSHAVQPVLADAFGDAWLCQVSSAQGYDWLCGLRHRRVHVWRPKEQAGIDTPNSQQSGFEQIISDLGCLIFRGSSAGPDD